MTVQGVSGTGSLRLGAAFFVSIEIQFLWYVSVFAIQCNKT